MLWRFLFAVNRFLLFFFASYTEALERAIFVGDPAIAPATRNGEPVSVRGSLEFSFNIY